MTSKNTKTTKQLMTNQKPSNNLIYLEENDVHSSAAAATIVVDMNWINQYQLEQRESNHRIAEHSVDDGANDQAIPLHRTTRKYFPSNRHTENQVGGERVHGNDDNDDNNKIVQFESVYANSKELHMEQLIGGNEANDGDDVNNHDNSFHNEINIMDGHKLATDDSRNIEQVPRVSDKPSKGKINRIRKEDKLINALSNMKDATNNRNIHAVRNIEHGMPEEDFRKLSDDQMRLESIKYQILTKLGLKRRPNITQTLPKHIIMSTLSRANEARMDTNTFRRHRGGGYSTFNLYMGDDGGDGNGIGNDATIGVNHIPNVYHYNNRERPSHDEREKTNNGNGDSNNQREQTYQSNKMDSSHQRFGDDDDDDDHGDDNYYGSYDGNVKTHFGGEQRTDDDDNVDSPTSIDDFYGHTREIIIFAEKGEHTIPALPHIHIMLCFVFVPMPHVQMFK